MNDPLEVVDTHTAGEPTRVIVNGVPDLGSGSMHARLAEMRAHADWVRTALIHEPRGSDWMVGATLQPPLDPGSVAGVIFFNNCGYLGMCGHGLIGVVVALHHRGQIGFGVHKFETPVGDVFATLHADRSVSITNVESYRFHHCLKLTVPGVGQIVGDVAYGGNWFFLTASDKLSPQCLPELKTRCLRIRHALQQQQIFGANRAEIDHIELFGPPSHRDVADARNFVLCPGGEYDRSPCGTGTSAKLACLAADGALAPGQAWRQQSIIGSVFKASYQAASTGVLPTITANAFVTAETKVLLDPHDPYHFGIPQG